MTTVIVRHGDIERAIRRLRKKVADDGTLATYSERQYFRGSQRERKRKPKRARLVVLRAEGESEETDEVYGHFSWKKSKGGGGGA